MRSGCRPRSGNLRVVCVKSGRSTRRRWRSVRASMRAQRKKVLHSRDPAIHCQPSYHQCHCPISTTSPTFGTQPPLIQDGSTRNPRNLERWRRNCSRSSGGAQGAVDVGGLAVSGNKPDLIQRLLENPAATATLEEKHKKRLLQLNLLLRRKQLSRLHPNLLQRLQQLPRRRFRRQKQLRQRRLLRQCRRPSRSNAMRSSGSWRNARRARPSSDSRWARRNANSNARSNSGWQQATRRTSPSFRNRSERSAYAEARGQQTEQGCTACPARRERRGQAAALGGARGEKEKARKRAERFGLVPKESGEDADKKRKRDARFNNPDPTAEDKKLKT